MSVVTRATSAALVIVLLTSAFLAIVGIGQASASDSPASTGGHGPLVLAQDEDEGQPPVIGGTLTDDENDPVAGVVIVVEADDGSFAGEASSADDGSWSVVLPAGGDYRVTLLEDTLPPEVELRNPDRASLEFSMRPGQSRTVLFPLGDDDDASGRGFTSRFLQALLTGIKFGLIIAMSAIGLSLIFGTTGLINFSHGELVTFGAVVAFLFNASGALGFTIHLVPATLIAVAAGASLGYGLERGLWRPLRARKTGLLQMLVISIGLMFLIRHILVIFFGSRSRQLVGFAIQTPLEFGPFRVTVRDLTIMLLSIAILVGVATLLQKTRLGKAMRAVADNRNLAESSGIDVQRIILLIWVMGGGLAATGGVFLGTVENVSWLMGFRLLLLMFAGVILGGLGTAYGAMVGSLVVGIVTEVSVLWFPSELKLVWALAVLIIILLVRPQGILGVKERIG